MQKSYLNIFNVETGETTCLKEYDGIIEAPNWNSSENALYFNGLGKLHKYNLGTGLEEITDTGICDDLNNDHVLARDEKRIFVSHNTDHNWFKCQIYEVDLQTGEAKVFVNEAPSFLHGVAPSGNAVTYCAFRDIDGVRQVDVYKKARGEGEVRLTQGGFNDGPEISPDGKHIWFNSTRSGLMQIYRMNMDGSEVTQMTADPDHDCWFAHVSPDCKRVVYLTFNKEDLKPDEHLPNLNVSLWLMNYDGSDKKKLIDLFGGQGTINVNSWCSDSKRFAYVSYRL